MKSVLFMADSIALAMPRRRSPVPGIADPGASAAVACLRNSSTMARINACSIELIREPRRQVAVRWPDESPDEVSVDENAYHLALPQSRAHLDLEQYKNTDAQRNRSDNPLIR
jgi:hypothetical protein